MKTGVQSWLEHQLGNKLLGVFALTYIFDSEKDFVNPQALDIRFESLSQGVLIGAADGETIVWQEGKTLKPISLGEYGDESVEEVSHLDAWSPALEKELQEFVLITSSYCDPPVGFALRFDDDIWVCVLNNGDELYVYSEIPEAFLESEGFLIKTVEQ